MAETPAEKKARKAREAEVKRKKLQARQNERAARRIRNLAKSLRLQEDKRRKNDQKGRHRE